MTISDVVESSENGNDAHLSEILLAIIKNGAVRSHHVLGRGYVIEVNQFRNCRRLHRIMYLQLPGLGAK